MKTGIRATMHNPMPMSCTCETLANLGSNCRPLTDALLTVFDNLWSDKLTVYSPDILLRTSWKLFPAFRGFKQHVG